MANNIKKMEKELAGLQEWINGIYSEGSCHLLDDFLEFKNQVGDKLKEDSTIKEIMELRKEYEKSKEEYALFKILGYIPAPPNKSSKEESNKKPIKLHKKRSRKYR